MRRLIILAVIFLAIVFLLTRFSEVQTIAETFQKGDWRWLILAGILHFGWMVSTGASLQQAYRLMGYREGLFKMVFLGASANFVNIVAPSGGLGGITVLASDAKTSGRSTGRVVSAAALYILFEYASLLMVIYLGLLILYRREQLGSWELIPAAVLTLGTAFLFSLLVLGARSSKALSGTMEKLGGVVNWALRPFTRKKMVDVTLSHEVADDINEALRSISRSPKRLIAPTLLTLISKVILILILLSVFRAFNQPYTWQLLITTYSIGYLFYIVSPTPSGIGFAEGATALTMTAFGLPLATATVLAITYRGFTFWLTLLYGMPGMRWVGKENGVKLNGTRPESEAPEPKSKMIGQHQSNP
jgi:uncharacterized protein (TIRG00374 family)